MATRDEPFNFPLAMRTPRRPPISSPRTFETFLRPLQFRNHFRPVATRMPLACRSSAARAPLQALRETHKSQNTTHRTGRGNTSLVGQPYLFIGMFVRRVAQDNFPGYATSPLGVPRTAGNPVPLRVGAGGMPRNAVSSSPPPYGEVRRWAGPPPCGVSRKPSARNSAVRPP